MRNLVIIILLATISNVLMAQRTNTTDAVPAKTTRTEQKPVRTTPSANKSNSARSHTTTPREAAPATSQSLLQAPRLPSYDQQMRGTATRQNVSAKGTQSNTRRTVKKQDTAKINWMTMEQALEKSKIEKKKIFIDVYTDWCGWCKRMDSTTFVAPAVANYINERYYPVKFNAEQQQDIIFKDKTYHFKRTGAGGCHELVLEWVNNTLKYPTIIFLDENQNLIQPLPGYQEAPKMEAIIRYFGDDYHKKTPWESFERNYVPTVAGAAQE